jgi:cytochrome c
VDPKLVSRPAGVKPYSGDPMNLVAEGERLWQDRSLGTSGLACGTCHLNYGNLNKTFLKPYPHNVAMPQQQAGLKQVNADEMVQFCMVVPMAGQPFGWASRELAALTAYTEKVQKDFVKAAAANPCLLKQVSGNPCNPCAAKNPCNPCAAKNPCSDKRK